MLTLNFVVLRNDMT